MSGVAIIRSKLAGNATLTATIPATSIHIGNVPENAAIPYLLVRSISVTQRNTVGMTETLKQASERVQVTVYARTTSEQSGYALQKSYMALVRAACPNSNGTINGFQCDSILPAGDGPDFFDDVLMVYEQSQDFMVKYAR